MPATCVAAAATESERVDADSAVRAISSLVVASRPAAPATPVAVSATARTVSRVRAVAESSAADMRPISSRLSEPATRVRSPSAIAVSTEPTRRSGPTIRRTV
ncbi:hypothetical protein ACPPVO_58485 [Dactylosporangium sp. McL0621]|uniref:hypothetical protein n=1 Tax=Dactylosporangium sp. McL0621 TaxID=3415678 RepID=UPI003CEFDE19